MFNGGHNFVVEGGSFVVNVDNPKSTAQLTRMLQSTDVHGSAYNLLRG